MRKKTKMNIKYSHQQVTLLILSASCLAVAEKVQAQTVPPAGPIRLESTGPVYTLRRVDIADTQPAEQVWTLQTGARETAYKSLGALSLRLLISRLPKGTSVFCTTTSLSGPTTAIKPGSSTDARLENFIAYCKLCGVSFTFGTSF